MVETDAAVVKQVKIKLALNGARFLKGPIPWNWIIRATGPSPCARTMPLAAEGSNARRHCGTEQHRARAVRDRSCG